MASASAELPEKDFENFRKAERFFLKKQYKQAVKACDLVLKKYEGHGDTTALKGAVLGRLAVTEEEKQEAVDLCKRGVASNMSNKSGWILLARLYRLLQRYDESIKAYKNALNLKVVKWVTQADRTEWKRDLATMLSQIRQWPEVAELRRALMLEGTNDALSQMAGYFMALYFAGDHELALITLREFRKDINPKANATLPDLDLLEARFIEAAGDKPAAIAFYTDLMALDKPNLLAMQENKARLELELGNFVAAQEQFLHLLRDRNPENYDYHRGLQFAVSCQAQGYFKSGLTLPVSSESPSDIVQKLSTIYDALQQDFPKSFAVERIALDFCPENEFAARASKFIHRLWKKKVSCLFAMVKPLLVARPELASKCFREIVEARLKDGAVDQEERGQILCFSAQLLDKSERGSAAALQAIEKALATDESGKNPDFLRVKARILKHMGDVLQAFEAIDLARQQELSDRYLNNKCAKYAFRKDRPELALALTHLFTRGEDVNSIPDAAGLHDLQCMWFELEAAESALRQGNVVFAIKNFYWVQVHVDQVREDEFDFHDYSLRKLSLTSYADMVRMEDHVYAAAAFVKSAIGSVRAWLEVFDRNAGVDALKKHDKETQQQKKTEAASTDESQFAGMTPNEKKTAMKRIKAEKAEKERLEAIRKLEESQKLLAGNAAAAAVAGEEEDDSSAPPPAEEAKQDMASMNQKPTTKRRADMAVDPDVLGFARFARYYKDPTKPALEALALAFKASENLKNAQLLLLAFDANVRTVGKLDQAWSYLQSAANEVGNKHPGVLLRVVKLAHFANQGSGAVPACWSRGGVAPTKEAKPTFVFNQPTDALAQIAAALGGLSPSEFATQALNASDSSVDLVLASAEALLEIGTAAADKPTAKLSAVLAPFEAAVKAQSVLAKFNKTAAAAHREQAKKAWPQARAFV